MKKSLMLVMALVLVASAASAAILASEDFSYADGALVGNGGWLSHSGTAGTFEVMGGQALIQNNLTTASEDVNLPFTGGTGMGEIFASFDFSVDALALGVSGGDYEYFAHFMDSGFGYKARLDIVEPNGAGDFSVGLSTALSTADVTWASDLTFDTVYHVVVSYNQTTDIARLWIDPAGANPPYIEGVVGTGAVVIEKYGFRQANSSPDELVRIDNLIVADACEDVFMDCPTVGNEDATFGQMKSLFR